MAWLHSEKCRSHQVAWLRCNMNSANFESQTTTLIYTHHNLLCQVCHRMLASNCDSPKERSHPELSYLCKAILHPVQQSNLHGYANVDATSDVAIIIRFVRDTSSMVVEYVKSVNQSFLCERLTQNKHTS